MKTEFVGEGSYGCVLKPAKKCDIELNIKNTVVKLFSDENEYIKEINNDNIIENIFKKNKNTIVKKLSNCIKKIEEYDIEAYSKCNFINYNKHVYQIIYEYGGIDLNEHLKKKTTFKKIFMNLDNIFFALEILKKKKYIHQDIRGPNILLNIKKKESKLIDFGFLIKMKNFNDLDNKYISFNTNYQYPPEINNTNYVAFFENFREEIIKYQIYFINNKKRKQQFKDIIHYLYQEIGSYSKYTKINRKKINYNKFDIYMLGTTLFNLFIISNLHKKLGLNDKEYNLILSFIKNLINFNIDKRYSVEKAKNEYFKIKNVLSKKK